MEENNNSLLKSALVLAIIVAAFLGYLYFKEKKDSQQIARTVELKTIEVSAINQKLDSLNFVLDSKIEELALMGQHVEDLEYMKASLEQDKRNLASGRNANLQNLENRIREYERTLAEKEIQLNNLRTENVQLAETNVVFERDNIQLQADKSALSDSVEEYSRENKELKEKLNIGAALRPIGYVVTGINKRGKETDGIEFKARRVDRLKLTFKLADNPLAQPGVKTIYMRLLNPEGNVIYDMALGSGVFNFGGKETIYTTKQNINYTNSNQSVEFIYDTESRFPKGSYSIELYSEGFRVGQTNFSIK